MKKQITDFNLNDSILKELKVKFGPAEFDFNISNEKEAEAYNQLIKNISEQHQESTQSSQANEPSYKSKVKIEDVKKKYFPEIERKFAPKTYSLYKREVQAFLDSATSGGNVVITALNKNVAVKYKEVLIKNDKITEQTIDSKLSILQSFFSYVIANFDYPYSNPFEGLKLLKKSQRVAKTQSYVPFTIEDLKIIFKEENFKKFYKANLAYYYIPVIALYSGMRLEEIAQLETSDVKYHNGVLVFDVNRDNEHQIKNNESVRLVPIHKKLIEFKFLEYWEKVKEAKKQKLFFQLKRSKKGYGPAVSTAFSEYLKLIEVKTDKKVFHSFRKSFNVALQNARIDEAPRSQIMGHKYESINHTVYGEKFQLEDLAEFVNMAKYGFELN